MKCTDEACKNLDVIDIVDSSNDDSVDWDSEENLDNFDSAEDVISKNTYRYLQGQDHKEVVKDIPTKMLLILLGWGSSVKKCVIV